MNSPIGIVDILSPAMNEARIAMREATQELTRLRASVDQYRRKDAEHERLIGRLYVLLGSDQLDEALDLVRAEFDAIHGPSD